MTALITLTVVVGVLTAVALVATGRWYFVTSLRRLNHHITEVDHSLTSWQHAHDHHIAELHRRLTGIEQATARAEREAREVSDLLVTFSPHRPHKATT